jgi:hypothetical protein
MYKIESVLGLVASILAAVVSVLSLAGSLLCWLFIDYFEPVIHNIFNRYLESWGFEYNALVNFLSGAFIILVIIGFVISAASFILGFIGTSKLKKGEKGGGVLLIVAGVLSLISVFEFIPFILFLVGGIMAVTKKPVISQQS